MENRIATSSTTHAGPHYAGSWDRTIHDPGTKLTVAAHIASLGLNTVFLAYTAHKIAKDKPRKNSHILDIIGIVLSSLAMIYSMLRLGIAFKYRKKQTNSESGKSSTHPPAPPAPTTYNEHGEGRAPVISARL